MVPITQAITRLATPAARRYPVAEARGTAATISLGFRCLTASTATVMVTPEASPEEIEAELAREAAEKVDEAAAS